MELQACETNDVAGGQLAGRLDSSGWLRSEVGVSFLVSMVEFQRLRIEAAEAVAMRAVEVHL